MNSGYKIIDKWGFILIQVLVPVICGFLSIMQGQDASWDLQNYHLYNAYAFLNDRLNFDLAPAGMQSYFNPFLDVVYFGMVRHIAPWTVGFILGFVHGLNFIVLLHICKYCVRSINKQYTRWAVIIAFMCIFSVCFLSELGTIYWDNVVSLFILTSLLIVIASMGSILSGKRSSLYIIVLAGVIAGMGAGLKLVAFPYVTSLFLSFFLLALTWKRKWLYASVFLGALVIGSLLTDGVWLWRIWCQTGNPVFPMMNNIFHGAMAPGVPVHDVRNLPKNFFEEIFFPIIITVNPFRIGDHHYIPQISWLIVYMLSVSFFLYKLACCIYNKSSKPLSPEVKFLFSFFWISFLIWLNMLGGYRYLVTIEMLIPLVLFVLVLSVLEFDLLTPVVMGLMLFLVTVFNINGVPNWWHSGWGKKAFHIETSWAQRGRVDSVILISQPVGWIVPALDMKVPFVQIMPNVVDLPNFFPVNDVYFKRAKSMIRGKVLVIFQQEWISAQRADHLLGKYGLVLRRDACTQETGYIGTRAILFTFCPAEKIK